MYIICMYVCSTIHTRTYSYRNIWYTILCAILTRNYGIVPYCFFNLCKQYLFYYSCTTTRSTNEYHDVYHALFRLFIPIMYIQVAKNTIYLLHNTLANIFRNIETLSIDVNERCSHTYTIQCKTNFTKTFYYLLR